MHILSANYALNNTHTHTYIYILNYRVEKWRNQIAGSMWMSSLYHFILGFFLVDAKSMSTPFTLLYTDKLFMV